MKRRHILERTVGALLVAVGAALPAAAMAQEQKTHRVVFDLSTAGEDKWEDTLRNVENVRQSLGKDATDIEVVVHSKALPFLLRTNTKSEEKLHALTETGVRFAACQNSMRRMKVSKEMLFPFAVTVDSGVGELVRQQEAGWSYLKVGG